MLATSRRSSAASSLVEAIRTVQETYRDDPIGFNRDVLRRPPYWWRQEEVCRSLLAYRITVVYSGNAVGKDYLLGGVIPWWGFTRTNSLTMVTGVSQTLLGSVTFKEVGRAVSRSPLLRALGLKVTAGGQRRARRRTDLRPRASLLRAIPPRTSSRLHRASTCRPRLLAVINENSGVEDEIY